MIAAVDVSLATPLVQGYALLVAKGHENPPLTDLSFQSTVHKRASPLPPEESLEATTISVVLIAAPLNQPGPSTEYPTS